MKYGKDIIVCGRNEVQKNICSHKPNYIVSLLDPFTKPFRIHEATTGDKGKWPLNRHLLLYFYDFDTIQPDGPTHQICLRILNFAANKSGPFIIHCEAGMCRSTAAALAIYVQRHGYHCLENGDALQFMTDMAEDRYAKGCGHGIHPNPLMAQYFDELLNCFGLFESLCLDISSWCFSKYCKSD